MSLPGWTRPALSFAGIVAIGAAILWAPIAGAAARQTAAPPTNPSSAASSETPATISIEETLRGPLAQLSAALDQVQIDHWKLSRQGKDLFGNDAKSIQRDLQTTLPGLFEAARQSPSALGPKWAAMHNVNALYDVLVRVVTAAELSGGKKDAAILSNASAQLETARNSVANQLLQASSAQDREMAALASKTKAEKRKQSTIIVNNQASHRKSTKKKSAHRATH
jgi:hypothetical protein